MKPKGKKTGFSVLVMTSSFPWESEDERGNFIRRQVMEMGKAGYHMVVLTPHIPGSSFHQYLNTIEIYRYPYFYPYSMQRLCGSGGLFFGFTGSFLAKIQMIPFLIMMVIYSGFIVRKHKISLIHTHWIIPQGIAGAVWKRIFRIPHITTAHVLDVTIAEKFPILVHIIRLVLSNVDAITVNSSYTKQEVQQISPTSAPIRIIPMGLDTSRIIVPRDIPSRSPDGHAILFVGRIIEWKGIDTLMKAVSLIKSNYPDLTLTIIGEGPKKDDYLKMIDERNLSSYVHMPGAVSDDDLNQAYASANLFILPSRAQNQMVMEGLGVVLLEAIYHGVPVIGSRIGGIPDIIEDRVTGFLAEPGDEASLAQAIRYVFENPEEAHECSIRAQEKVSSMFNWDHLRMQFDQVYQDALLSEHDSEGFLR
jgi:glycosyltransferase involved in cell wall biosynthesis